MNSGNLSPPHQTRSFAWRWLGVTYAVVIAVLIVGTLLEHTLIYTLAMFTLPASALVAVASAIWPSGAFVFALLGLAGAAQVAGLFLVLHIVDEARSDVSTGQARANLSRNKPPFGFRWLAAAHGLLIFVTYATYYGQYFAGSDLGADAVLLVLTFPVSLIVIRLMPADDWSNLALVGLGLLQVLVEYRVCRTIDSVWNRL